MNKVILMGNLTRDPEVRYTSGENPLAIARFGIAVNRRFQSRNNQNNGGSDVDFINCVAFGRTGENIGKFFTKGRKIAISGRLQTSSWEDNNGQKRTSTDVVVEDFDFCDRKGDSEGGSYNSAPAYNNAPAANNSGSEKFYDVSEGVDEEDLPF
ncbi:MAG: single-stranded DNA-binding protein [Firmicutes bacterium]|nr:single-stranded DNA-binding protein [Bacillota bacterium]MBQ9605308.1 single-stranded DNA-binding protein [Bacillota bacterium]